MPTHWRALPGTPTGILPTQKSAYCVGAEATNAGEQIGDVTGSLNPENTGKNVLDLLGTLQHSPRPHLVPGLPWPLVCQVQMVFLIPSDTLPYCPAPASGQLAPSLGCQD